VAVGEDEKQRIKGDMHRLVGARDQRHANFVEVQIGLLTVLVWKLQGRLSEICWTLLFHVCGSR
jgi:hypothetical protein